MKYTLISTFLLACAASAAAFSSPDNTPQYGSHGGKKRACSQSEIALATGIHLNINGQYAEYNGTLKVEQVETQQPQNTSAFDNAKGQLQSDIQAGMNIRLFNQQIAPKDNPAIPGLKQYEAAQETEKSLAAGLTGKYSDDKEAIEMLKKDIMMGIELNERNLKAAVSLCESTLKFPLENQMGV